MPMIWVALSVWFLSLRMFFMLRHMVIYLMQLSSSAQKICRV